MSIKNTIKLLNKNSELLKKSLIDFEKSINKCKTINLEENLTFEEQESLDALASKFARISDIFTQKIIKSVAIIYRENCNTFIDRINFAEKIGLIPDASVLIEIRDLRNDIAHEYIDENLILLYKKLIELSQKLLIIIDNSFKNIETNDLFKLEN